MTTSYPGGLDNFTNPTSTDTLSSATVPHATQHTNANDAIKAIETELGTNPKGSYASVAARLAASTGSITTWRKAASGGETSLTGTDDFSTTLAYTVGQEQVFINGVLLERGVDYTATTGSSITGLTALVASDIATVISVGTFNVANAIPLSQFTAKGDILVGTGASTEAALNIGADGSTLVANSSASTGVSWAGQVQAGKNAVINGGFDIWQRGTSFTGAQGSYTADRWTSSCNATGTSLTVTQSTSVPNGGIYYSAKYLQATSSATSVVEYVARQFIETSNIYPLMGKTVTLSFWYMSNKTGTHAARIGGSSQTGGGDYVAGFTVNAANTWQFITISSAVPFGSATAIATSPNAWGAFVDIGFRSNGTTGFTSLSANDYFQIANVQLEASPVATPFSRAGGTLQGELAACQRYYFQTATYSDFGVGSYYTSTHFYSVYYFPVTMRATPSANATIGSANIFSNGSARSVTAIISSTASPNTMEFEFDSAAATAGNAGHIGMGSGYIQFSSEL